VELGEPLERSASQLAERLHHARRASPCGARHHRGRAPGGPLPLRRPSAAASSGCAPARPSRSRAGFGPSGAGGTRSTRWPLRTRRAPPWWTCWPRRGQGPLAGAALLATTAACWSRASPASATTSCLEGRPRPRCPSMGSTMSAGWGPRHGRLGPVRFEGPMSATTPGSSGCSWPPWRRRPPASTPASRPAGTASTRRSAAVSARPDRLGRPRRGHRGHRRRRRELHAGDLLRRAAIPIQAGCVAQGWR
jgi:hypothetical protein